MVNPAKGIGARDRDWGLGVVALLAGVLAILVAGPFAIPALIIGLLAAGVATYRGASPRRILAVSTAAGAGGLLVGVLAAFLWLTPVDTDSEETGPVPATVVSLDAP